MMDKLKNAAGMILGGAFTLSIMCLLGYGGYWVMFEMAEGFFRSLMLFGGGIATGLFLVWLMVITVWSS